MVWRMALVGAVALWLAFPSAGNAQQPAIGSTTLAEKRVTQLPTGTLVFRLETFPSRGAAESAASSTGLVAELGGRVYLVTLGPAGGTSPGGTRVAEVGPVQPGRPPRPHKSALVKTLHTGQTLS